MKKLYAFIVVGFVFLFVGTLVVLRYWQPGPKKVVTNKPKSNIRIGFALGDLREERWQRDRDLFVAEAEKLGAYVQVTSANSDAELQNSQMENLISQKVDVIVVAPYNGIKISEVMPLAKKAGIKVVSYDRLVKNSEVDFYVSFDNVLVGEMEAAGVVAVVDKGNFAYIGGAPTDNNASLLKQGSMKVLDPFIKKGQIKLVVDQFTEDWKPELAYKTIRDYLSGGGKLDAVVAANDGTAFGAIRALKEFGLDGKVPVSGQDAELAACQRVVQGTQTLTVYKPISALAVKAANIAVGLAKNEMVDKNSDTNNGLIDVPSFLLDPIMVTKQNIDETVIKDGFQQKEQVYKL